MRNRILLASLLLGLAACNNDDDDTSTPTTSPGADLPMSVISAPNTTIRLSDLPAPDTNASVTNYPQVLQARPAEARFQAPAGFVVNLFADVPGARNVVIAPNGDVFIARSNENTISVLRDTNGDGHADETTTWAAGGMVNRPHGMVFHNGALYVAMSGAVMRYTYQRDQTTAAGEPTMLAEFPGGGQHPYRGLVIDSAAGKMYVAIGSATNVGPEDNAMRATIQQYNLDGSGRVAFAEGIRNPMPMAINPVTRTLWSCVNERDGIGDELVPDYFASVPANSFFGWPYVYLAPDKPDPRAKPTTNDQARINSTRTPEVLFKAHAAALGLVFYTGTQFPEEYRGDVYVTMRGSWNRLKGEGYKLVRIRMNAAGQAEGGYEDFLTGWQTNPGASGIPLVFGRPVAVAMAKDGSLLITDDAGGAVWRLRYKGQ